MRFVSGGQLASGGQLGFLMAPTGTVLVGITCRGASEVGLIFLAISKCPHFLQASFCALPCFQGEDGAIHFSQMTAFLDEKPA